MTFRSYINNTRTFILMTMLMCGMNVHAQIAHTAPAAKIPWRIEAEATSEQFPIEVSRARIILFHFAMHNDVLASAPLNIFIDGQYYASLLPGQQSISLPICPGQKVIQVSLGVRPGKPSAFVPHMESVTPELQRGEIYFYQIAADKNGRVYSRWVSRELAREALENVKVQTHSISRVSKGGGCPADARLYNVHTLFKFAQHDASGMIAGSSKSLALISERISKNYSSINKVIVTGYSDPIGSESRNQYLSERRAATVVQQMVANGLPSRVISSRGAGAANLVVADCGKYKSAKDKNACNKPNRRVEIEVYGTAVSR
jgi:OOP family OmpA-OmpF porin